MTDLQHEAMLALTKAFVEAGMNPALAVDNAKNCLAACFKNEESLEEVGASF